MWVCVVLSFALFQWVALWSLAWIYGASVDFVIVCVAKFYFIIDYGVDIGLLLLYFVLEVSRIF